MLSPSGSHDVITPKAQEKFVMPSIVVLLTRTIYRTQKSLPLVITELQLPRLPYGSQVTVLRDNYRPQTATQVPRVSPSSKRGSPTM
jgi:hypothetical protein